MLVESVLLRESFSANVAKVILFGCMGPFVDEQIVGLCEPPFAVLAVQLHFHGPRSVVAARGAGPPRRRRLCGQNRKHGLRMASRGVRLAWQCRCKLVLVKTLEFGRSQIAVIREQNRREWGSLT